MIKKDATDGLKYNFDPDFQQEILQFSVTDYRHGHKAIPLIESHYFTTIEHSLIAEGLKRFYNKKFSIPSQAVLKEELKQMFRLKQFQALMDSGDKEKVFKTVKKLYLRPVKNPDDIYNGARQFAQYSAFKSELEDIDINDPSQFGNYVGRLDQATKLGSDLQDIEPLFVLRDMKATLTKLADHPPGFPTPFWQLNAALNNGGSSVGNVYAIMAPAKRFKTGLILNLARGYLKQGKVTVIADFENGAQALGLRAFQGIGNLDRKELLSQKFNKKLLKMGRQYKRFGGEIIIHRFSAGESTTQIALLFKKIREKYGVKKIHNLIVDYADIMGNTAGISDETKAISQVYIDLKTLANEEELESTWTPSHITREGDQKQGKKFKANDISKAIDKIRHADLILGVNQDEAEKEAGIMRLEIVDQRDGISDASMYFWSDIPKQRLKEFNAKQVKEILEMKRQQGEEDTPKPKRDEDEIKKKKKKISDL